LLALKGNGGVIQIVGFSSYLVPDPKERTLAMKKFREDVFSAVGPLLPRTDQSSCPIEDASAGGAAAPTNRLVSSLRTLPSEKRVEFEKRLAEIDREWPAARRATVRDLVDHIDYAVKLIGIDHVGIASDFDGGGGIDGWNGANESFNVTLELVRRGYSEEQITKLWGGNLLRVWEEVEKISQRRFETN
jgi:membrane dipeptidase